MRLECWWQKHIWFHVFLFGSLWQNDFRLRITSDFMSAHPAEWWTKMKCNSAESYKQSFIGALENTLSCINSNSSKTYFMIYWSLYWILKSHAEDKNSANLETAVATDFTVPSRTQRNRESLLGIASATLAFKGLAAGSITAFHRKVQINFQPAVWQVACADGTSVWKIQIAGGTTVTPLQPCKATCHWLL